jgi:RNA polymerase sigma-70 factor (ECF subfamily)
VTLSVDTALVARARDGSEEALGELLERCAPKLLALIRTRLACDPGARALRARLDSRDLLQNVLIKALGGLGDLQAVGRRPLQAWLAQIAENELRDQVTHHRRQRRDLAAEVAVDGDQRHRVAQLAARVRSASSRVVLRERIERLMTALAALEDSQREVVVLRDFEELSWAEVGERLGRSADAARMLYARALTALTLRLRAEADAERR